ncbi:MAG: 3-isopropylmalate dehydratase large subunit [Parvularculaceae bacterium]|nr:3-isopropylmalate dehydratase large subunit [Parvularculaceae bacterium]
MSTYFDLLWDEHRIAAADDVYDLIAIDRLLLHERTGGVALKSLAEKGYHVADPSRVFAIVDHIVSFRDGRSRDEARSPGGEVFIQETRRMANAAGIQLIDTDDPRQGIVHVAAPELGLAAPGLSLVCPDSHTCTLGALGALAWGIGSSEAEHAAATGCLRIKKPEQLGVRIDGKLRPGVAAKDLALHLISAHGASGGRRAAVEFFGDAIEAMSVDERLTLCNMAAEFGAFTAIIQPDAKVLEFMDQGQFFPRASSYRDHVRQLVDASVDPHPNIVIDATDVESTITFGTSPEDAAPLAAAISASAKGRALDYMGLESGQSLIGLPVQGAFIGSCTNGRLSDLQAAAKVLRGRRVADGVRAVCVPGSWAVRREAEALGLDQVFLAAGFEWGTPGCAMCFYAGGETFPPGSRVISSTNRNFEGRQGPGVRTHLASPAVVAASAIAGAIASPVDLGHLKESA